LTAIARLAGIVQGVVVQMTIATFWAASLGSTWAMSETKLNFT
jgi:hypothetical protein